MWIDHAKVIESHHSLSRTRRVKRFPPLLKPSKDSLDSGSIFLNGTATTASRDQATPSHLLAALRAAPYHQFTSAAPGLLQLPTKQTPRANKKTELCPNKSGPCIPRPRASLE
jgi:hypothetical protein